MASTTTVFERLNPFAGRRATRSLRSNIGVGVGRAVSAPVQWEFVLMVGALFLMGAGPVVFLRDRLVDAFGSGWIDDDLTYRLLFVVVEAVVVAVAVSRARPSVLLRQPFLLVFLAICWASISWSVQPGLTLWRSSLFVGAAAVGWYLGDRFKPRDLLMVVVGISAVATVGSLIAVLAWPEHARTTVGTSGAWSGLYTNRQGLGVVLCVGLLATFFLITNVSNRARILIFAFWAGNIYLLIRSGNRTAPIALIAAVTISAGIFALRRPARKLLTTPAGAVLFTGLATIIGGIISWNWSTILDLLGKSADLTGRTEIWAIDERFLAMRPLTGWGFDTIWTDPIIRAHADAAFPGSFHDAHNGYLEILLGVGAIGFAVFAAFLIQALARAFLLGWRGRGVISLWPLSLLVFILVVNIGETRWDYVEAMWALTVAAAIAAANVSFKPKDATPADAARG